MRVGMDTIFSQGPSAAVGIGNYSFGFVSHLAEHPDVDLFLLHADPTSQGYVQALSHFILANNLDIFHLTTPAETPLEAFISYTLPPVRLVATVYDTIPLKYPDVYLPADENKAQYHQKLQVLRHAHRLLAISENTRTDFIDAGFDPNKIVNIGTGTDQCFFPRKDISLNALPKGFPTDKPFVLAFNPADFRKNADRTVEAFCIATRDAAEDYQLVFTSGAYQALQDDLRRIADRQGRAGSVHFVGQVTKSQLLGLYNRTEALLFPSLYEGLGLPVLEAMQCGTPVLASDVSSLPELAGDAVVYVDPTDVLSIASGIRRILFEPSLRTHLRHMGLARAQRFTWSGVVAKAVVEYHRLMDEVQISGEQWGVPPNAKRNTAVGRKRPYLAYPFFRNAKQP